MKSKLRSILTLAGALLGLVLTGVGCTTFRGLQLDLTMTSGPSLRLLAAITAGSETNSASK